MKHFLSVLLVVLFAYAGSAQITKEDYAKSDSVMKLSELVYNQVAEITWIDSSAVFWYRLKTRDGMTYQLVDAQKGSKKVAFDTNKLVYALNRQLEKDISASDMVLRDLKFDQDKRQFILISKRLTGLVS